MQVRVDRDPAAFQALQKDWTALVPASMTNVPFLTWEWQSVWWKHFGAGNLALISLRDEAGALVGVAPLCQAGDESGSALCWVGCVDVSDYLDVLARAEHRSALYGAILDFALSAEVPVWKSLDLCNIPEASPTHIELAELARQRGLYARASVQEVCPVIPLPSTFEEYLAQVDRKQRHEIRRKISRAHREGQMRLDFRADGLDDAVSTFITLHSKSAMDKRDFMNEQMQAFFRDMARAFQERNWLQLVTLYMDERPAASMFNFDYNGSIMVYNSGYDPEEHAWLSPGIVLLAECIAHAIELGRSTFDFLRGGEDYKYRFGAKETRIHRLQIAREPF